MSYLTKAFSRQFLVSLIEEHEHCGWSVVKEDFISTSGKAAVMDFEMIFQCEDYDHPDFTKTYRISYYKDTKAVDEIRFFNDGDMIECLEVKEVEEVIARYVPVAV